MLRKEINAITLDELKEFFEFSNLLHDFNEGKIRCKFCDTVITTDNIFSIFYKNNLLFCCNNDNCMDNLKKKSQQ